MTIMDQLRSKLKMKENLNKNLQYYIFYRGTRNSKNLPLQWCNITCTTSRYKL